MKDTGDLFSKICDMDNLRKAHKNAKRGKGWYAEVKCIEKDLDHYLKRLQENLIEHRYHTSEYEIFTKKESNKESPTYSEWCSFNSYVGWLQHCDSFRLYQKYVEPNVEYMHNYYLKEVKGNAEICKRKNYSGERKAS